MPCLSSSCASSDWMWIGCSRSVGNAQALALPRARPTLSKKGRVLTSLIQSSYVGQQVDLAVVQVRFHSLARGDSTGPFDSNVLLGLRILLLWEYRHARRGNQRGPGLLVGP